jgi:CBS domain-containing protein
MHVSEMMSVRLVTCAPTRTIAEAARLMVDTRVGSVLVCDGARLAGILTERDVMRLVADRLPVDVEVVGDHMTRSFTAVPPDARAEDVAELMRAKHIRHMPIVDGDTPVGMVSLRDFFVMAGEVLRHQGAEAAGGIVRAAAG